MWRVVGLVIPCVLLFLAGLVPLLLSAHAGETYSHVFADTCFAIVIVLYLERRVRRR